MLEMLIYINDRINITISPLSYELPLDITHIHISILILIYICLLIYD